MSRLLKATFECEVITPMFLAGAVPSKPEFRISSIKAELRFWLRAVLGGLLNQNTENVALIEQLIMGGTKFEANQSNLCLRIIDEDLNTNYKAILPHKNGKRAAKQNAIIPNSTFTIEIKTVGSDCFFRVKKNRQIKIPSKDIFNIGLILFQFSVLIGGFGRRSNRGFGSVQINKINSSTNDIITTTNDIKDKIVQLYKELTLHLSEVIKQVSENDLIKINSSNHLKSRKEISKWPIIDPNYTEIKIGNNVKWSDFIYNLMNKIHKQKGRKLKQKVLGGFNPRQGSTMKISMIKGHENMYPVFVNFITDTKHKPNKKDFEHILSFPEQEFGAESIEL